MAITMDPYEAYKKFLAIKLHFKQDSYDYFKYRGSVRANPSSFETRKDKYFFHKLSKKHNLELFLACNLRDEADTWVGKLFDEKYEKNFRETQKRLQSLEYLFKVDMQQFDSLNDALVVSNGNYPRILNEYKRGNVMAETLIILNGVLNVFDYWSKEIDDTILWPRTRTSLEKYGKFFSYDKNKYNTTLKELF